MREVYEAFDSSLRYLEYLVNIAIIYLGQIICQICPTEIQLNKANVLIPKPPFFYLDLSRNKQHNVI